MEIKTLLTAGFEPAFYAMRSPLSSWAKSDSEIQEYEQGRPSFDIGPADMALSQRLQKAGPEHCKHLRMIMVWADITAPLTWWKQADCYRNGVEKISTSTMHTLMKHELTADNFEPCNDGCYGQRLLETVDYINELIRAYNAEQDPETKKKIWEYVIQILPQSFLQKRTVMFSYAALRNIVRQRKGHKLSQWSSFIDWAHTLPYANQLIFDKEE